MTNRLWLVTAAVLSMLFLTQVGRAEEVWILTGDAAHRDAVEQELRDMQRRYGIQFRPLTQSDRPVAPSSTASPGPLIIKIDRKTRAKGRIPRTDKEFSELTEAAREGPVACYAWIYGKDSPVVQELQGHSWSELGDDDGIRQCRAEASRVRSAQSLFGF